MSLGNPTTSAIFRAGVEGVICAIAYYDRCENSIVGVNIVSSTCPCELRQSSSVPGLGLSK